MNLTEPIANVPSCNNVNYENAQESPPPHNFHQCRLPRVFSFSKEGVRLSGDFACLSAATSVVTAHISKIVTIISSTFNSKADQHLRYKMFHKNPTIAQKMLCNISLVSSGSDVCSSTSAQIDTLKWSALAKFAKVRDCKSVLWHPC